MCGGKIKQIADEGSEVAKDARDIAAPMHNFDPTTNEGVGNILTGGQSGITKINLEATKDALSKKKKESKLSASEIAASEVAVKEYDFAREMDFVKDEYAARVERLGSSEMQNAVTGRATIDAQKQTGAMIDNTAHSLSQAGIDPSSGRATATMTKASNLEGDAIGNAKSQSSFALDSASLEGRSNRIAMAMGEKTKAVAGLQDIAAGANNLAINKANNEFNSNAANSQAVGTAVGIGSQAYLGRDED